MRCLWCTRDAVDPHAVRYTISGTRVSKKSVTDALDPTVTSGRKRTASTPGRARNVKRMCGVALDVNVPEPPTTAEPMPEPPAAAAPMTESVATPPLADLGESVFPRETVSEAVGKTSDDTGKADNDTRLSPAGDTSGSSSSTTADDTTTSFIDDELRALLDQVVVCCGYALFVTGF